MGKLPTFAALIALGGFPMSLAEAGILTELSEAIQAADRALPYGEIEYTVRVTFFDEELLEELKQAPWVDYDNATFTLAFKGPKARWEYRNATMVFEGQRLPVSGQYAFDGEKTTSIVASPGILPSGEMIVSNMGYIEARPIPILADIRDWGLSHFSLGRTLSEIIEQEDVSLFGEEELHGKRCHVFSIELSGGKESRVWVDPATGHRLRKIEDFRNGKLVARLEVTAFNEVAAGVWLPASGTREIFSDKRLVERIELLSAIPVQLTADLEDRFEIQFPSGIEVLDFRTRDTFIAK